MIYYNVSLAFLVFLKSIESKINEVDTIKVRLWNDGLRFNIDGIDYDYQCGKEGGSTAYYTLHSNSLKTLLKIMETLKRGMTLEINVYVLNVTISC